MVDKIYIPPDYNDDEIPDDIATEDEGVIESYLDKKLKEEEESNKEMSTPPFPGSSGTQTSIPRWGQPPQTGGTTFPWQQPNNNTGGSMWGSGVGTWKPGGTGSTWGQSTAPKESINRNKKVIFIDFLDCICETLNSNQVPGYLPRDIYDLAPRFDVWQRLSAFNPERIYIMVPKNLLPSTNGANVQEIILNFFCCSLSSFLRVPFTNCQVLVGSVIGQSKESLMLSVIDDPKKPITRSEIVSIGIYSGYNGQPDTDRRAAENCHVDYIDLYNLLNNMV